MERVRDSILKSAANPVLQRRVLIGHDNPQRTMKVGVKADVDHPRALVGNRVRFPLCDYDALLSCIDATHVTTFKAVGYREVRSVCEDSWGDPPCSSTRDHPGH